MKVCYLVSRFPSATQTFVYDEVSGQRAKGVDVRILSLFRPNAESDGLDVPSELKGRVFYVPRPSGILQRIRYTAQLLVHFVHVWLPIAALIMNRGRPNFRLLSVLGAARILHREMPDLDILHCHFGPIGLHGAVLKHLGLTSAKLVATFHGVDASAYIRRNGPDCYALLFRHADLMLPVSRYFARRLETIGADPRKVQVHHMGVDCSTSFNKHCSRVSPDAPLRIVSVGRLVRKKGHHITLEALAIARRSGVREFLFELIGGGPEEERLQAQAAKLELRVQFLGGMPHRQVLDRMEAADLFVLASTASPSGDEEGIPVGLMEAMARGLPVVSTRHSGIPELVEHGVSGLLAREGDAEELAGHIVTLLNGPDLRKQMGKQGRHIVESKFNRSLLAGDLHTHYSRLLDVRSA
ncbi:MAG: glycosyltransferase [Alphaproteobacteria bacterium]|nr:glycosyltransferase [Alphaproteobacteria bacterium]MBV9064048.1 glycosyltransferase [Alphaproteobacteria bacterium]